MNLESDHPMSLGMNVNI